MNKEQLEDTLKQLTDGLMMQSKTEEPFEFFYFENEKNQPLDKEIVAHIAGKTNAAEIETDALENFFSNKVQLMGNGSENEQLKASYETLQQKLRELLQDVTVFKASSIGTTVYILGKTENGDFAGLRTFVIEK